MPLSILAAASVAAPPAAAPPAVAALPDAPPAFVEDGAGQSISIGSGKITLQPDPRVATTAIDLRSALSGGLGHAIVKEWENNGSHKEAADPKLDQAILHTDNATPFREIVGVLDAIYSAYRPMVVDQSGAVKEVPAFNMTFSVR